MPEETLKARLLKEADTEAYEQWFDEYLSVDDADDIIAGYFGELKDGTRPTGDALKPVDTLTRDEYRKYKARCREIDKGLMRANAAQFDCCKTDKGLSVNVLLRVKGDAKDEALEMWAMYKL